MIDEFVFSKIKGKGLPIYTFYEDGRYKKKYVYKNLKVKLAKQVVHNMSCYECKGRPYDYYLDERNLGKGVYQYRIYCDLCYDSLLHFLI